MTVVNVKSQVITDMDATPPVKTNPYVCGGRVRSCVGDATFVSSDATSVARVLRVPSRARVHELKFSCADLGAGGTVDIGLHRTSADGGAVVDADFFASAVDTDSAAVAMTDVTYESGVVTLGNYDLRLWEQLGLTKDPNVDYDITVTRNTATGNGLVALKCLFVTDD